MLETKTFGSLPVGEDNIVVLPAKGPLLAPLVLELDEVANSTTLIKSTAHFVDHVGLHIAAVKHRFLETYDDVAGFVPEWLEEELPEDWSKLVGGKPASEITAQDMWDVLVPKAIVPLDDGTFMFDFAFGALEIDQIVNVRFDHDGKITELDIES